jgi:PhzF family phenazine biosynthesis protein
VQPRLAEAHSQGKIQTAKDYPVVSIVKGMTFVLVELESLVALDMVSLASCSLTIDGLNDEWCDTFIGTYFFVRTGPGSLGVTTLRTRMIEGTLEDPATGSAASDLAAYLSLMDGKSGETLSFEIIQGVEMGRRSKIFIDVEMANEEKSLSKIYLTGGAVQVMEGRCTI